MKALCIGDLALDVVALLRTEITYGSDTQAHISTHGGGTGGNVATWLGSKKVPVFLVTRVGKDTAGDALIRELDAFGVEHNAEAIEGIHTGVVISLVDSNGERTMFPDSGANAGLSLKDLPPLTGISVAYISGYSFLNPTSRPGVIEMAKEINRHSIPIIFDPASIGSMNFRGKEGLDEILKLTDVMILNRSEAEFLSGTTGAESALTALLNKVPCVVIKTGADGAIAQTRITHTEGGDVVSIPAHPADVKDTTGAGDAFAAGFIASWMKSRDLSTALTNATQYAAECVAIIGARPHVAP